MLPLFFMKRQRLGRCRSGKMSRIVQFRTWLIRQLRQPFRLLCFVATMIAVALLTLILAVRLVPFDDSRLKNLDVSMVVFDINGQFLRAYLSQDQRWRIPARLDKVSPWMVKATIAAEDKRFYNHHGIDLIAVARAMIDNIKAGRIISGASTISMQVAGFAIDSRERTFTRKLKQAFTALQLEIHWDKKRILQCYLTHASYGGNICGVEAAARRYFNKTAAEISVGEAALLAGIPQSPERFRPDRHIDAARRRRSYVLSRLLESKEFSTPDFNRISSVKVETGTFAVPVYAPHFCDAVRNMYPNQSIVHTTLRLDVQRQAELALGNVIRGNRYAGVTNGSIVIMENVTGNILAMVGSADYWNKFDQGEVNGALGFRSPGSALKPFIFGEAMDSRLLEPDEMLYDVPVTISGYSPVNYDRQFRGPVPAAKALAWSLNIPAIEVMQRVGVDHFKDILRQNGIATKINPLGDQGLSMAIGTCSVRLLDLTAAYAAMANGGVVKDPVWVKSNMLGKTLGRQWLSKEASAIILSILADETIRPPEEIGPQLTGLHGVAWKTGTSNGLRDAWTMAVTRKYTVGVWIGNMDGRPSNALVGGKIAAPVALGLAKALKSSSPVTESALKNSIIAQPACLQSGLIAGPECSERTTARFLRETPPRTCNIHRRVAVDSVTGYSVCERCQGKHQVETKKCALYPGEVASWMRVNEHPWVESIRPAHNPDCKLASFGEAPVIVTPSPGTEIVLLDELPVDFQKITLTARSDDPATRLFWFVDGSLVGSAPAYESIRIDAVEGKHRIRCVDSRGRAGEGDFRVERSGKIASNLAKEHSVP